MPSLKINSSTHPNSSGRISNNIPQSSPTPSQNEQQYFQQNAHNKGYSNQEYYPEQNSIPSPRQQESYTSYQEQHTTQNNRGMTIDYSPDMFESDGMTFDYFPDISLDEVTVNNIQHDEQSAREAVEAQERIKEEMEDSSSSSSDGQKTSIGFILTLVGILVPIIGIVGFIICLLDLKKPDKKLAKAGVITFLVVLVLDIIAAFVIFFVFPGFIPTLLGKA